MIESFEDLVKGKAEEFLWLSVGRAKCAWKGMCKWRQRFLKAAAIPAFEKVKETAKKSSTPFQGYVFHSVFILRLDFRLSTTRQLNQVPPRKVFHAHPLNTPCNHTIKLIDHFKSTSGVSLTSISFISIKLNDS